MLLPSGPDTVHESPLRGTRPSTSLEAAAFESGDLGREFSPAGADCRYRAPLVPRLARRPKSTSAQVPPPSAIKRPPAHGHPRGTSVDPRRPEFVAERAGFEPATGCPEPHFQCGAIVH